MNGFAVRFFTLLLTGAMALFMVIFTAQGQTPENATDARTGIPGDLTLPNEVPKEIESIIRAVVYVDGNTVITRKDGIVPDAGPDIDSKIIRGVSITATVSHESGIYVKNGGDFTIEDADISKPSGPLTYNIPEDGEFGPATLRAAGSYGLNAVVLVGGEGSRITLNRVRVSAMGQNGPEDVFAANAVFATFGGIMFLNDVIIQAEGRAGHGVNGTNGGAFYIDTAAITTTGDNGSALTTDNPGGDIYAKNVIATVSGSASAGIYCDGGSIVEVSDSAMESRADCGMVICNDGFVKLDNVKLIGRQPAVKIHFRRGAARSEISNSTLVSIEAEGILFDGGCGNVVLDNTAVTAGSGKYLIKSQQGSVDRASGEGSLTVRNSTLTGTIGADETSILKIIFSDSSLEGSVDLAGITLDADSRWKVTAPSRVIDLNVADPATVFSETPVTVTFGSSRSIKDGQRIGNITFVQDTSLVYPEIKEQEMGMQGNRM